MPAPHTTPTPAERVPVGVFDLDPRPGCHPTGSARDQRTEPAEALGKGLRHLLNCAGAQPDELRRRRNFQKGVVVDNLDPENDAAVDPAFLAELREADPQDANSLHVGDVEAEGNVHAGGLNTTNIDESAGIASPFEALDRRPRTRSASTTRYGSPAFMTSRYWTPTRKTAVSIRAEASTGGPRPRLSSDGSRTPSVSRTNATSPLSWACGTGPAHRFRL